MKALHLTLAALLCVGALSAGAQQPSLSATDVSRFCQSFPGLMTQMESLGMTFDPQAGTVEIPDALRNSTTFRAELAARGWGPEFFGVMQSVMRSYATLAYHQSGQIVQNELPAVQQKIRSLEGIPASLKQEMLTQAASESARMDAIGRELRASVPEAHLNAMRSQLDAVTTALGDQP